jgi:hypothetical protein
MRAVRSRGIVVNVPSARAFAILVRHFNGLEDLFVEAESSAPFVICRFLDRSSVVAHRGCEGILSAMFFSSLGSLTINQSFSL